MQVFPLVQDGAGFTGHTDLYLTTHKTQQTNICAPGRIRTHNLSRRSAADLRLRQHGHWDRQLHYLFVFGATVTQMSQGLLIHEVSRSHTTTHHSR